MPRLVEEEFPKLALALADLDLIAPDLRGKFLGPGLERLAIQSSSSAAGRLAIDECPAVLFCCPTLEAALVLDLLRSHCREMGVRPLRCWVDWGQGWRRVPTKLVLTIKAGDKLALNPTIFADHDLDAQGLQPESLL